MCSTLSNIKVSKSKAYSSSSHKPFFPHSDSRAMAIKKLLFASLLICSMIQSSHGATKERLFTDLEKGSLEITATPSRTGEGVGKCILLLLFRCFSAAYLWVFSFLVLLSCLTRIVNKKS